MNQDRRKLMLDLCNKTVYVIQNLNINLTAEVIHQLNMNPQEVINHYHELIQREIEKNH